MPANLTLTPGRDSFASRGAPDARSVGIAVTRSTQLLVNFDVEVALIHVVAIGPKASLSKTGSVAVRQRPSATNCCDIQARCV